MSLPSVFVVRLVSLSLFAALLAGCSARQTPPATPVDKAATPTFRSSTNSYDQPNTPKYTQPGLNGGTPVTLPPIKTHIRFDQNAPLAVAVFSEIRAQLGVVPSNYITVQTKGGVVKLGGTVPTQAVLTKAVSIAKEQKGVTSVLVEAKVQQ